MKQKTIDIPIYCGKLTMILDKDLSFIEKKYKTYPLGDYGAITLKVPEYRNYVVAFTDAQHLSNIAHEVVHLKNYIFSDCQMKSDSENDEHEAYLTGWLFDEIYKFLKNMTKEENNPSGSSAVSRSFSDKQIERLGSTHICDHEFDKPDTGEWKFCIKCNERLRQ